jgi:hypothetical protein
MRAQVQIICADGSERTSTVTSYGEIGPLIGAATLDSVNLRNGQVMFVDDNGWETECVEHAPGHIELRPTKARKPINVKATAIYHGVCIPGTTHQIVGDVAIVNDRDFA